LVAARAQVKPIVAFFKAIRDTPRQAALLQVLGARNRWLTYRVAFQICFGYWRKQWDAVSKV
jgi:hypothetical protein